MVNIKSANPAIPFDTPITGMAKDGSATKCKPPIRPRRLLELVVGPLQRVGPRNSILGLVVVLVLVLVVVPIRSEFIGEL